MAREIIERTVVIPTGRVRLLGDLGVPSRAEGAVLFAHGSGSGRKSPRNRFVAQELRAAGLATLLLDLLTEEEEMEEHITGHLRFDVDLLTSRLSDALDWLGHDKETRKLRAGCFGASTGAAAALVLAAERPEDVHAVVSRGGRPDLAGPPLRRVWAPTLLIVGSRDVPVLALNQKALEQLRGEKQLDIVSGATHLFEEPGALEEVARLATRWFVRHLAPPAQPTRPVVA